MRGEYSKLVKSIEATGSAVRSFSRERREARSDLAAFSHQLVEMGTLLDLWQHEASTSDGVHKAVSPLFPRIQKILKYCHEALLAIEGLLKVAIPHDWDDFPKTKLDGMLKHLDACTISLEIALEMAYL